MSEMEKAQLIHHLQENFDVPEEMIQLLISQITDPDLKNNLPRIKKGLKIEDEYQSIFGALPWVKNIHGLNQKQEKKHKKEYQTPDYSLLIEDSQKKRFPLLVDVKCVEGDKQSCQLSPKQITSLNNYSRDTKTNLLIAIYWKKYRFWTHNCLKNFTGKKKNKIKLNEAVSNDLSHILSDYIFQVTKPFYRKTIFSEGGEVLIGTHEKYGNIQKVFIGQELDQLEECTIVESCLIDDAFIMKEIELIENEDSICQVEVVDKVPQLIKLSNWIIGNLFTIKIDITEKKDDILVSEYNRYHIVELAKRLGFDVSYPLPPEKNKCTDRLFEKAYFNTVVMENYLKSKSL